MIENNKIKWIYNHSRNWDFWFVDVEWIDKGYYVFPFNRGDAMTWDEVLADVKIFKWKPEAVIKKIVKRADNILIWKIQILKNKNFWFIVLKGNLFKKDIFVSSRNFFWAKNDDIVWIKITKWDWRRPEWKIVKVLWKEGDKNLTLESLILESWFRQSFNNQIKRELDNISMNIPFSERKKRVDLTKTFTFTIDWEDAKDLDDAISIKKKDNGDFLLYVHIADVTHYVRDKSLVDREAITRWTSVYLADRVIPMLPEKLSNSLCSLNPDTEKLTLTCEIRIGNNWKLKGSKVYESIIKSDFRLTYKEVDDIICPPPSPLPIKEGGVLWNKLLFWWIINDVLIKSLELWEELRWKIEQTKLISWVLNFDFTETKIIIWKDWKIESIQEYPKYKSNKLIEEFMVMANEAVSREFSEYPFLYRVHEEPKDDDIAKLQSVLDLFWVKYRFKKGSTKEFSELLELISKGESEKILFIQKMILGTLTKAIYSHENYGHFGLGLEFYSHFTSPIRRYPDLQIHRIIKEKINKTLTKKRISEYKEFLPSIAQKTSIQEKKAEQLEYKVRDYYIVRYYEDRVWEEFVWSISWMIPKWIFVQLPDTAEWFILWDNWMFNESLLEFHNLIPWKRLRLWDEIKVKLIEADLVANKLTFVLI